MKLHHNIPVILAAGILVWVVATSGADTNSPPSNHTGPQIKTPYKANAEDFSGQNPAPGRFQLFQGSTLISAAGDSTTMPAVLKIDSQTGRTWLLVITDATGTTNFGFVELPTVDRH